MQDAWVWCTGLIRTDGFGGEVGEGYGIGNTCGGFISMCGKNQYNIVKKKIIIMINKIKKNKGQY